MKIDRQDLFISGTGHYHTYRIPALLATPQGTLLAFCEGRKERSGDSGWIDLLVRRSTDGGETWQAQQVIHQDPPFTIGNPSPVYDRETGAIHLVFCRNNNQVFVTESSDQGQNWKPPREITAMVKRPNWGWYATGPVHGIQLRSGRLLIPCDHRAFDTLEGKMDWVREAEQGHARGGIGPPSCSHVIYSEDHGDTWKVGGVLAPHTNECVVLELDDGSLYLNMRNTLGRKCRAWAKSIDGGLSWSDVKLDETLIEPVCQGSLIGSTDFAIFANPASTEREKLTLRLSDDGCRTWPKSRVLHPGPAAYSDLCIDAQGRIHCLFECGENHRREKITLARIDREWLEQDG